MTMPLVLLVVHFVADFVLQSNWMATNKSKNWFALTAHVSAYSACFFYWGWAFVGLTWITHFATDAVTSRLTSRFWFVSFYPRADCRPDNFGAYPYLASLNMGDRHWFFVIIGADQLIHACTLAWTWSWLS